MLVRGVVGTVEARRSGSGGGGSWYAEAEVGRAKLRVRLGAGPGVVDRPAEAVAKWEELGEVAGSDSVSSMLMPGPV